MTREEIRHLIERYADGPRVLHEAYAAAPAEMHNWHPTPDAWSIREILCHCADAEATDTVSLRSAAPAASTQPPDLAFSVIDAVRTWTTPILLSIDEAQWASDAESGDRPLTNWLSVYGNHLHEHADQIRSTIEAWHNRD
jgi:hypothetical protein